MVCCCHWRHVSQPITYVNYAIPAHPSQICRHKIIHAHIKPFVYHVYEPRLLCVADTERNVVNFPINLVITKLWEYFCRENPIAELAYLAPPYHVCESRADNIELDFYVMLIPSGIGLHHLLYFLYEVRHPWEKVDLLSKLPEQISVKTLEYSFTHIF